MFKVVTGTRKIQKAVGDLRAKTLLGTTKIEIGKRYKIGDARN